MNTEPENNPLRDLNNARNLARGPQKKGETPTSKRAASKIRRNVIGELADEQKGKEGEIEFDLPLAEGDVSEGDDNGCYVRAWVWVDFGDTPLDKEAIYYK